MGIPDFQKFDKWEDTNKTMLQNGHGIFIRHFLH